MNTQAYDQTQWQQVNPTGPVLQSLHDGGVDDDTDGPKAGRGVPATAGEPTIRVDDDSGPDDDPSSDTKTNRSVPAGGASLDDNPPDDDTGGPKTNKSIPADDE